MTFVGMLSQGAFSRSVCGGGVGVECVAGTRGKCFGAAGWVGEEGWRAGSGGGGQTWLNE